jgi:Ca2+-binding RTX toxin-like protein
MNIIGDDFPNRLEGTPGDDTILARGGNDTLRGLGGNDGLFPGSGDDILEGGAGNDTFGYTVNGGGRDIILDFFPLGQDVIDLAGAITLADLHDIATSNGDNLINDGDTGIANVSVVSGNLEIDFFDGNVLTIMGETSLLAGFDITSRIMPMVSMAR